MKTSIKKIGLYTLGVLAIGFIAVVTLSPFGNKRDFNYKLVIHSVEINAPVDSVYNFLGKSSNAAKWSVFVNHINPLNSARVADGKVGCKRRCFKNSNEQGLQWDEEITVSDPNKRRQLTIFNMKDFGIKAEGLATEQLYEPISGNKTKLSFTLFYLNEKPSVPNLLKTYFSAFKVKSIYKQNMANIKRIVETGRA
jgi:uncharacterized membrane protein